jgi:cbb3-type cytochrome oxidase maturation protein
VGDAMNILLMMIPITFLLSGGFLAGYIWAIKSGQFDDTYTPALRMLGNDTLDLQQDKELGDKNEQ